MAAPIPRLPPVTRRTRSVLAMGLFLRAAARRRGPV
jgi:hypothetical protein